MRKRLMEDQNNGKAIEVRLEQDEATYYTILAGMTVHLLSGCARGICEPTGENEYLMHENEIFRSETFSTYREAKELYDAWKQQYVD